MLQNSSWSNWRPKRVRRIVDSYDVLGGPHTFNVVWASSKFYGENRKIVQAFVAALDDAMKQIAKDPAETAALWVKAENAKLTAAYIEKLVRLPENEWTMVPKKVMSYADYMSRVGMLQTKPATWRDVFFEDTHNLPGS